VVIIKLKSVDFQWLFSHSYNPRINSETDISTTVMGDWPTKHIPVGHS